MSTIYANGLTVLNGQITLPRVGAWHADLMVDADSVQKLGGSVNISINNGAYVLRGTTFRAGVFAGYVRMRVVAGNGTLRLAQMPPKSYQRITLGSVLTDIARAAGEALSAKCDQGLMSKVLRSWATTVKPAASELLSLLQVAPGASWRMLFDGTLWVGYEQWPTVDSQVDNVLLEQLDDKGSLEIAAEPGALAPGTKFKGRQIDRVVHHVQAHELVSVAYFGS